MTKVISKATRGFAYDNLVINGAMDVSQEVGATQTTLVNNTARYSLDQWMCGYNHTAATAVVKFQQVTPPGSPSFGTAYGSCLQMTATTALGSPASGDYAAMFQYIEGVRTAQLAWGAAGGRDITIGFWVYATITGTMGVAIRNSAANRSYVAQVTINSTTTWEYKTVTIPADTTGTWLKDTGIGLFLSFALTAGSTIQGTVNTWTASNIIATSSQTNFLASTNNTVCITGVGVWAGNFAPNAATSPMAKRSFDQELTLCKRYYQLLDAVLMGGYVATTSATNYTSLYFMPMRVAPTITVKTAPTLQNSSYVIGGQITTSYIRFDVTTTTGGGPSYVQSGVWNLNARL